MSIQLPGKTAGARIGHRGKSADRWQTLTSFPHNEGGCTAGGAELILIHFSFSEAMMALLL